MSDAITGHRRRQPDTRLLPPQLLELARRSLRVLSDSDTRTSQGFPQHERVMFL